MQEESKSKRRVHPLEDVENGSNDGSKVRRFPAVGLIALFTSKSKQRSEDDYRVSSLGSFWWKKVRESKEKLVLENKYGSHCSGEGCQGKLGREDVLRIRAVEAFHRALYKDRETNQQTRGKKSTLISLSKVQNLPIIMPDSRFKIWWDSLVLVFVLLNAVLVPFQIGFDVSDKASWGWLDICSFLIFTSDIILQFFTAFVDTQGKVVTDRKQIAKQYLRTWFTFDLIGTIPFELFAFIPSVENSGNQVRYLSLLKTPRLLRLGKLMRMLDKFEMANVLHITRLFFFMILVAHWMGCIWYPLVIAQGTAYLHAGLEEDDEALQRSSAYLMSFYNCLLLMTGEDLKAYSDGERLFCSIGLALGVCFYGFVVGNVMFLLNNMDAVRQFHREKIDILKRTCAYLGLPNDLQTRIGSYFHLLSARSHPGPEGMKYLDRLPSNLREDIAVFLHMKNLRRVALFQNCEEAFLREIAVDLHYELYAAGEKVFSVGDIGHNMFLIIRGSVAISNKSNETIAVLREGDAFGEAALITSARRTAGCTTITSTDIAVLTSGTLERVMEQFPESAAMVRKAAYDRLNLRVNSHLSSNQGQRDPSHESSWCSPEENANARSTGEESGLADLDADLLCKLRIVQQSLTNLLNNPNTTERGLAE